MNAYSVKRDVVIFKKIFLVNLQPTLRSFPGPYFPAFGLNTEIYSVNIRIFP